MSSGLAKLYADASSADLTVASAIGSAVDPIRESVLDLSKPNTIPVWKP